MARSETCFADGGFLATSFSLPARAPRTCTVLAYVLAICFAARPNPARACDTPVYRFAIYSPRWTPSDYAVWYLHEGQEDAAAEAANRVLVQAQDEAHTNLRVYRCNVHSETELAAAPSAVQTAAAAHAGSLPLHLVLGPDGGVLAARRLDAQAAAALVDSPARRQRCKQASAGKITFLLVEGADAAANDAAAAVARSVADKAARGQIDLRQPGLPRPDQPPPPNRIGVMVLRISRQDVEEQWLIEQLMQVEGDLHKYAAEPLLFVCFGRGRALPPFATLKGITEEGLTGELRYVCGPCTCEIKNQNPGMDLLTTWNWPAAAEELARELGEQELLRDDLPALPSLALSLNLAETKEAERQALEEAARAAGELAEPQAEVEMEPAAAAGPATEQSQRPSQASAAKETRWLLAAGLAATGLLGVVLFVVARRSG